MFVKPAPRPAHLRAPGQPAYLIVRDPMTGEMLPEDGREVPDHDLYWRQRLTQGDVIRVAPAAKP